eukprot:SAG11_NODE_25889_length_352_cov_1.616601_1_plen_31_part_01
MQLAGQIWSHSHNLEISLKSHLYGVPGTGTR